MLTHSNRTTKKCRLKIAKFYTKFVCIIYEFSHVFFCLAFYSNKCTQLFNFSAVTLNLFNAWYSSKLKEREIIDISGRKLFFHSPNIPKQPNIRYIYLFTSLLFIFEFTHSQFLNNLKTNQIIFSTLLLWKIMLICLKISNESEFSPPTSFRFLAFLRSFVLFSWSAPFGKSWWSRESSSIGYWIRSIR